MTKKVSKPIESTIDLRLTKNDILEMFIAEEEERLRVDCSNKRKICDELIGRVRLNTLKSFEENNAVMMTCLCAKFGSYKLESYSCGWGISVEFDDRQCYFYVPFGPEDMAEVKAASDASCAAERALSSLRDDAKRNKIKLTRQLLEQTEEGKAILGSIASLRLPQISAAVKK